MSVMAMLRQWSRSNHSSTIESPFRCSRLAAMYLRFVTTRIDQDSPKPQGVLVASYALLDSGALTRDEWRQVRDIPNWFNANLPHPPKNFTAGRAIFWFKSSARKASGRFGN